MFVATNHQYMMFFTQKGKCFWMRVYEIPEGSKKAKGRAIQNLIIERAMISQSLFVHKI
jgi:DNA gyrase subunit A